MAYDPSQLHPLFRARIEQAIAWAAARGVRLVPVQGHRTHEEQAALYAQGRTAPGAIVTQAGPGQSLHNYGVAVDLVPADLVNTPNWSPESPLWDVVGQAANAAGLEWGGNWTGFVDRPHVQMADTGGWRTLQTLPRDEQGFVVLGATPGPQPQHGAPARQAPLPTGAPASPVVAENVPAAPPAAPPTPIADAVVRVGQAFSAPQGGPAANQAEIPQTPRLAAADFAENSRNRLSQMTATLMPAPETGLGAAEAPMRAFNQPFAEMTQKPDPFKILFGPARSAPLGGGTRIRA